MTLEVIILIAEAVTVYALVLAAHSLRSKVGLAHYYALVGGVTAVMSWVTDAGVEVNAFGVTFLVGSTVFYTSLLLSVFVVYVFDGPRATRVAISTVLGVSIMVPLIALTLNMQMKLTGFVPLGYVPTPSLRINLASVLTTAMDLLFLAVSWEFLNNRMRWLPAGVRAFITLLGVMCLDVLLFNTGAFAGNPDYLSIMQGTLVSRLIVCLIAGPMLWLYVVWQNRREGAHIEQRPVLAILHEITQMRLELSVAREEIERRKLLEAQLEESRAKLEQMAATDSLTGLMNRRRFSEAARQEMERARRYDKPLSLIMLDVDHFKGVNDTYGHEAGDQVLVRLAGVGGQALRSADLLARYGGDECVAMLPETDLDKALQAAERLRTGLAGTDTVFNGLHIRVTVSQGVAQWDGREDLDGLLNRADKALYRAKNEGRNLICEAVEPAVKCD